MSRPSESVVVTLLARARSGDDAAREELFDKCRNYVALLARSQVESWMHQKVDASDLVQQTLLDAHRGFQDFRGGTEAEWLTWLRMILNHNAHDFIRHFKTDKRHVSREVDPTATRRDGSAAFFQARSSDPTPSQLVMQHEQEIALADAIAALPEDYQEVIVLRNLQRLPFEEIAQRMDRSGPAVQMLWMRAIRKLQQILTSSGSSEQP